MNCAMFRCLLCIFVLLPMPLLASVGHNTAQTNDAAALTYRLTTISVVRDRPNGRIVDIWNGDTLFTSNVAEGDWVRVTGTFPGEKWQSNDKPLWINRHYVETFTPKHSTPAQDVHPGVTRYVEVDKSKFLLKVVEEKNDQKKVIFKTKVALGMDRCLPKSKGGRCYYTEPGTYHVRWKIHDPDGIQWCIPKSMEKEYARTIARGKRCFRGAIGTHALNIGKTYAIHGTSNPSSLGKRVSHGCIRTANKAVAKLYKMLDVGDKVYIKN